MIYTTKSEIRKHGPCRSGWHTLCKALGPDWGDEDRIEMRQIVAGNGLEDALWCLRALLPTDEARILRVEYACRCAESVLYIYIASDPEDGGLAPMLAIHLARECAQGRSDVGDTWAAARAAWAAGAAGAAARAAAWAAWAAGAAAMAARAAGAAEAAAHGRIADRIRIRRPAAPGVHDA